MLARRHRDRPLHPKGEIFGNGWPVIPTARTARLLSLQMQLDQSQWWEPEEILAHQFRQLRRVVEHANETVSFYKPRLEAAGISSDKELDPTSWRKLPLLTRRDLQNHAFELCSSSVPPDHGKVTSQLTSGSTGQPVMILTTDFTGFFWHAFTLRDHRWHQRDFSQKLAAIRYTPKGVARPPHGIQHAGWGSSTQGVVQTGPCVILSIHSTIEQQASWLKENAPGYLLSYPSALRALADYFIAHGQCLPGLKEVRSFGEIVEPGCREACRRAWGVEIADAYSSQEVGYITIQCPECEHHHVQSENVLVEVLKEHGQPCGPGEIGQVVVTTLHNFAMPLLRYAIGDYAEVGERCGCGRGLPVLKRILGRQRNILRLPDGSLRWPSLGQGEGVQDLPPFRQFQIIQRTLDSLQAKVVRATPFTAEEEERMKNYLRETLGYPFRIAVEYVNEIARSPSGKFEDFRSELEI